MLVLGGGGILGEAWMTAVLVGIEEVAGFDACGCEGYVGTSAGSIVAAALTAGIEPRSRLGKLPEQPEVPASDLPAQRSPFARALRFGLAAGGVPAAPLAALGLRTTEAGGALLRRAALARLPAGRRSLSDLGREVDQNGARWDGRLAVSAVEVESGRRVMFGMPGRTVGLRSAPRSRHRARSRVCSARSSWTAVAYVDGGVWSPTNMDRAPAGRGTRVLCLNPTGSLRPSRLAPFGGIGLLSRSVAAVEALALQRRGARVMTVSPDAASRVAMGTNLMDSEPRSRVIAAGLSQGRALGLGRASP